MEKIRVGIIGTGNATGISTAHLNGYRTIDGVTVTAVYNHNINKAEQWCKDNQCQDIKVCSSLEEFFQLVDAVSICTPNFTHVDYIKKCLETDKHVLCEKPIGIATDDLNQLADICNSTQKIHMINFNYRRIPAIRMISNLVQSGKLGEVFIYRHTMGGGRLINEDIGFEWRMDKSKSGTGSLGDFGSHILDTMQFITGINFYDIEEIKAIEKTCIKERDFQGTMKQVDNDDCSIIQGLVKPGILFTLMTSRVGALGNQLEVIGTKGIAKFDMLKPLQIELELREEGKGFSGNFKSYSDKSIISSDWYETSLPTMLACGENVALFIDCIKGKEKVPTDILSGINVQNVINSIDKHATKI